MIAASRKYVCIRLLTYESREEAEIIKSFFIGRSGELENTIFTLLSPDGKTKLVRAGRSPNQIFEGAPAESLKMMVRAMDRCASEHAGTKAAAPPEEPPLAADLRLALDVAACDALPLVVAFSEKEESRKKMLKALAGAAWSTEFIGRFQYVCVSDPKDLKPIAEAKSEEGYLVVQPDPYGLTGKILVQFSAKAPEDEMRKGLTKALGLHKPASKDPQDHIREGHRKGIDWKTLIPDTDPGPGRHPK